MGPSPSARRAISEAYYERDPDRFLGPPSSFAKWAAEHIRHLGTPSKLIDLGSGPGRDARLLAEIVGSVRAVDHSSLAVSRGRAALHNPKNLEFEETDLLAALRSTPPSSVDVVYAHAVYMILSPEECDEVAHEVYRILRPGGLHLFAVRATTDPHVGRGTELAPDHWLHPPDPEPIHYFRREALGRFTRAGFARVAEEHSPGTHMWFVCDRRP